MRTSGLWEEKLLFGFESWRDSTSLALNFNGLREIKRCRLREGRREERKRDKVLVNNTIGLSKDFETS